MKPSKKDKVNIKFTKCIPFGHYFAMMWKGDILIKKKDEYRWNILEKGIKGQTIINHETIHLKQAVSTHDSWFLYYLKYVWLYLKNIPIIFGFEFPYRFNAFELEAYGNESDLKYLDSKDKTIGWKKYNKLSLKEKRKLYKKYRQLNNTTSFSRFVVNFININI